jgi:hypothetical protein
MNPPCLLQNTSVFKVSGFIIEENRDYFENRKDRQSPRALKANPTPRIVIEAPHGRVPPRKRKSGFIILTTPPTAKRTEPISITISTAPNSTPPTVFKIKDCPLYRTLSDLQRNVSRFTLSVAIEDCICYDELRRII